MAAAKADRFVLMSSSFATKSIDDYGATNNIALVEPKANLTYGGLTKEDPSSAKY